MHPRTGTHWRDLNPPQIFTCGYSISHVFAPISHLGELRNTVSRVFPQDPTSDLLIPGFKHKPLAPHTTKIKRDNPTPLQAVYQCSCPNLLAYYIIYIPLGEVFHFNFPNFIQVPLNSYILQQLQAANNPITLLVGYMLQVAPLYATEQLRRC